MWNERIISRYLARMSRSVEHVVAKLHGHNDYTRFIIIGNARTGTNYLRHGLNTSPDARVGYEILSSDFRKPGEDIMSIINRYFVKERNSVSAIGFKILYFHLSEDEWDLLSQLNNIRFIHIRRVNKLRTIVSYEIAKRTNKWLSYNKYKNLDGLNRIRMPIANIISELNAISNYESLINRIIDSDNMIEVFYEDLLTDPISNFNKVGNYISIDNIRPDLIRINRQNPQPLSQLVVNYDEVQTVLADTEYAKYLCHQ